MHPATDAHHLPSYGGERPELRATGAWSASLARPLLIAAVLGAVPLAAAQLLRPWVYVVADATGYLAVHNVAELFSIVVSLSIFGVGFFTYDLSRDRHSAFLACAFLGVGLMDLMHTMSFPGMSDFLGASAVGKTSQYWLAARLFTASACLASAFVRADSPVRWLGKWRLLAAGLAFPAVVLVLVSFFPERVPVTFDAEAGLTPFKVVLEYLIVLLFVVAAAAYVRRWRRTGDPLTRYYVAAFVVSAWGELAFTTYRSAFDTFNALGHVYKVVAFCLVYRAVFVGRVQAPYLGFAAEQRALEAEILERRAAEAALRSSEESLKTAQRIAHVGNWDLDLVQNRLCWSDEIYRIYEIDPRHFGASYEAFLEAVHPEDRRAVHDAYTASLARRTPYEMVHRLLLKDGRVKHVRERCETHYDGAGRPLRSVGTVQDVTERAEAEERERASAQYARSLIEASLDPLFTISPEGKVTDVNRATEEVTGLSRDHLVGTDFADHFTEPALARAGYRRVLEQGFVRDYPLTIRHVSGRTVDVLYNATVFRDQAGHLKGVFAAARDVTERLRAEQELARLATELEQRVVERTEQLGASNRELEAFVYSVSHDLRAPLRHIGGFVELLQRRTEGLDDQARHYATVISQAASAMGTMIDDLLSFSRMGRGELAKARVDLEALVRDLIRELGPEAEGRVVDWKVGKLPAVRADREMLRLAMTNLLANAVKFTRTRGRAEIEIGCAPSGDKAETVIFVRDNGVGFDPAYGDKLFKVFQRLHRAEDFEGTGIGLANVRRIVERHGGRVWAEGALDRGATFYLSLPRHAGDLP